MIHREAEEIAVRLGADRGNPPRVRQQADLAEVRAIRERGRDLAVRHYYIDYSLLYEVHFRPYCTLLDDDIAWKNGDHSCVITGILLKICFLEKLGEVGSESD